MDELLTILRNLSIDAWTFLWFVFLAVVSPCLALMGRYRVARMFFMASWFGVTFMMLKTGYYGFAVWAFAVGLIANHSYRKTLHNLEVSTELRKRLLKETTLRSSEPFYLVE